MARPTSISTEQILDTARRLFLERGQTVSTAVIAKEAGVSEGSIFRRFKTKDDLFLACMELPAPEFLEELPSRIGEGSLRETIERIAQELIEFFRLLIPRVSALKQHASFDPLEHLRTNRDAAPHRVLRTLTDYFDGEVRLGRIRPCDPEVAARTFIGGLHNYVFFEHIGVNTQMPFASTSYVRAFVDLLWSGLDPAPTSTTEGPSEGS